MKKTVKERFNFSHEGSVIYSAIIVRKKGLFGYIDSISQAKAIRKRVARNYIVPEKEIMINATV